MKNMIMGVGVLVSAVALAVDGTWQGTVDQIDNGSWSDPSNWGGVVPGGAGSVLTFPKSTQGNQLASATLDGAFTVGRLDVALDGKDWTFKPGNGGILTMDTGSAEVPSVNVTAGTRGVTLDVPIAGTNGLALTGMAKSFVTLKAANTYTGDTLLSTAYLRLSNSAAVGNTSAYRLTAGFNGDLLMSILGGVTVGKPIYLEDNASYNKSTACLNFNEGADVGDVEINGNVYVNHRTGGKGIQLTVEMPPEKGKAVINGDILADPAGANADIGLRGDNGTCVINGKIDLGTSGALGKNGKATYILNHPDNHWTGTMIIYNGTLILGATNALSVGNSVQLTEYGTGGTVDLNGFDQTIGAFFKSGTNSDGTDRPWRVVSAKPAVLTMEVTDNNGGNNTAYGPVNFEGALTLRKTGAGTQDLTWPTRLKDLTPEKVLCGTNAYALVSGGIEVLEGTLKLNMTRSTARITVDGGALVGSTTLQYTASDPETFTLKSGSADVSKMAIAFDGSEVAPGLHLVCDFSAGGELTGAEGSPVYPFASCDGLPEGCRWVYDANARKCYLRKPLKGLSVIIQ